MDKVKLYRQVFTAFKKLCAEGNQSGILKVRLDNNEVERINRYISLTRRRLIIGSHSGAEAAALYYSLAITCHRYKVNVFDYFCDIIDRWKQAKYRRPRPGRLLLFTQTCYRGWLYQKSVVGRDSSFG